MRFALSLLVCLAIAVPASSANTRSEAPVTRPAARSRWWHFAGLRAARAAKREAKAEKLKALAASRRSHYEGAALDVAEYALWRAGHTWETANVEPMPTLANNQCCRLNMALAHHWEVEVRPDSPWQRSSWHLAVYHGQDKVTQIGSEGGGSRLRLGWAGLDGMPWRAVVRDVAYDEEGFVGVAGAIGALASGAYALVTGDLNALSGGAVIGGATLAWAKAKPVLQNQSKVRKRAMRAIVVLHYHAPELTLGELYGVYARLVDPDREGSVTPLPIREFLAQFRARTRLAPELEALVQEMMGTDDAEEKKFLELARKAMKKDHPENGAQAAEPSADDVADEDANGSGALERLVVQESAPATRGAGFEMHSFALPTESVAAADEGQYESVHESVPAGNGRETVQPSATRAASPRRPGARPNPAPAAAPTPAQNELFFRRRSEDKN